MLQLVTPPASLPVTVDEVKASGRIDATDEDALLAGLIAAATAVVDGPAGLLGRPMIAQTWRLTLDAFPAVVTLPLAPVTSIASVKYLPAAGGALATLAPSAYAVRWLGTEMGNAELRPVTGTAWPATSIEPGAVEVEFVGGYGAAGSDVPAAIRQAITLHVLALYADREAVSQEPRRIVPMGYFDLLTPHRLWGFG